MPLHKGRIPVLGCTARMEKKYEKKVYAAVLAGKTTAIVEIILQEVKRGNKVLSFCLILTAPVPNTLTHDMP